MGFVLNALGLNGTLVLVGYVVVAMAIVVGQGAIRWLKPDRERTEHDHIVDLFFISLFFTMNTSLLVGTLTKADHFGFYTFETFTEHGDGRFLPRFGHTLLSLWPRRSCSVCCGGGSTVQRVGSGSTFSPRGLG